MITSIGHRSLALARARMIAAGLIEADGEEICAAVNLLARSDETADALRAERLLRRAILAEDAAQTRRPIPAARENARTASHRSPRARSLSL